MRSEVGRAGAIALLMFLSACAADLVIKNARIYTVDTAFPWAISLAIEGIAACG